MRLFGRRRGGDRAAPRYSNEAVIQRIQLDAGVDRDTARSWFDEMLLFLDLAADSREFISPPKPVDAAWHAFILHTRDYEAYCRERFGRIIHHEPTTSPNPEAYRRAYDRRRVRGLLDPAVWAVPFMTVEDDDEDDEGGPGDGSAGLGTHHYGGAEGGGDWGGGGSDAGGGSACGGGCGCGGGGGT